MVGRTRTCRRLLILPGVTSVDGHANIVSSKSSLSADASLARTSCSRLGAPVTSLGTPPFLSPPPCLLSNKGIYCRCLVCQLHSAYCERTREWNAIVNHQTYEKSTSRRDRSTRSAIRSSMTRSPYAARKSGTTPTNWCRVRFQLPEDQYHASREPQLRAANICLFHRGVLQYSNSS